jgi:nitroreductase
LISWLLSLIIFTVPVLRKTFFPAGRASIEDERDLLMDFKDLVLKNRSTRRFLEERKLTPDILVELVAHARLTASGFNRQPLKYILSTDPAYNDKIFAALTWGGSVTDWPQPKKGERPAAYVVVLTDTSIRENADIDVGICAQTILLAASARGLAGCMFRAIDRKLLQDALSIPVHLAVSLVIALGSPAESIRIADAAPGEPLAFYRTAAGEHVVPKRTLAELIHACYGHPSPEAHPETRK